MHFFTEEQRKFIKENAKGIGNVELTEKFNKHFNLELGVNQIKAFKKNNHIRSGLTGRFKKGHQTWNKNKKKTWKGGEETQFKKGHTPKNHRPIGSERVDSKDGYLLVKIAEPNKWKAKHRVIWEEANGSSLPKGHAIMFADGNICNFDLDNLILVSRRELLVLNQENLIQKDTELTKTALNIAKLKIKIQEVKKNE